MGARVGAYDTRRGTFKACASVSIGRSRKMIATTHFVCTSSTRTSARTSATGSQCVWLVLPSNYSLHGRGGW
ncbi:MAG: hypothetical protein IKH44_06900 [Bacteroidales bacterium]|nr:hypothetical protein [Bacteroidales bacterium]